MKVWGKLFILLLGMVSLMLNSLPLSAQQDNPASILINFAETVESDNFQGIRAYFTLLNATHNPLSNPDLKGVTFNIDGTDSAL